MKRIICLCLCVLLIAAFFTGCDFLEYTSSSGVQKDTNQNGDAYVLSFVAEFYDNNGTRWLTTQGSKFDISPNKVKEYYYDNDGSWVSGWTMSSVVSIDIDGNSIDSCGSTVLIYDNYLVKQDCVLPADYVNTASGDNTSISDPSEIRFSDAWTLDWWWITKDTRNYTIGSKIIVIQSQEGNPICLFSGNSVSWEVSRNLPKTTEITIDNAKLYVHRANFAVIDKSLFNN